MYTIRTKQTITYFTEYGVDAESEEAAKRIFETRREQLDVLGDYIPPQFGTEEVVEIVDVSLADEVDLMLTQYRDLTHVTNEDMLIRTLASHLIASQSMLRNVMHEHSAVVDELTELKGP